jgi:hypothetical protein
MAFDWILSATLSSPSAWGAQWISKPWPGHPPGGLYSYLFLPVVNGITLLAVGTAQAVGYVLLGREMA